jgi:DNA ligase-1
MPSAAHGKRSSYYSDYTFGVWTRGDAGDELVPVGKAYFGLHRRGAVAASIASIRRNTTVERFGPVRQVVHEPDLGLVLEVAFEAVQRVRRGTSPAWRCAFPRDASGIRWDKPPREADRLETLERMLISMTGS